MTIQEANSLVRYIQRCSDRFQAEALPLGVSEALVLLIDTQRQKNAHPLPPVRDVALWLCQTMAEGMDDESCRELLQAYLTDTEEAPEEMEQVRRDLRPSSSQWLSG